MWSCCNGAPRRLLCSTLPCTTLSYLAELARWHAHAGSSYARWTAPACNFRCHRVVVSMTADIVWVRVHVALLRQGLSTPALPLLNVLVEPLRDCRDDDCRKGLTFAFECTKSDAHEDRAAISLTSPVTIAVRSNYMYLRSKKLGGTKLAAAIAMLRADEGFAEGLLDCGNGRGVLKQHSTGERCGETTILARSASAAALMRVDEV
jgi:hypothetical protein